jgi:hypothetical protein
MKRPDGLIGTFHFSDLCVGACPDQIGAADASVFLFSLFYFRFPI